MSSGIANAIPEKTAVRLTQGIQQIQLASKPFEETRGILDFLQRRPLWPRYTFRERRFQLDREALPEPPRHALVRQHHHPAQAPTTVMSGEGATVKKMAVAAVTMMILASTAVAPSHKFATEEI